MNQPDLLTVPAGHSAAPVILLGLDDKNKRHASYFDADLGEQAVAAATRMGMATLPVVDDTLAALAGKLPKGKIFGSGKAFVPFVGEALFEELASRLPDRGSLADLRAAAAAAEAAGKPPAKVHNQPKSWDVLAVGDLVLANDGPDEGWWESIVEAITGEMVTLKWQAWPEEPNFVRKRDQLGLLPPKSPTPAN